MRKITDIGKQGAENLGTELVGPTADVEAAAFDQLVATLKSFPARPIPVETSDGIKKPVEVHALNLSNPKVFKLMHHTAAYRPTVYAQIGGRRVMGMLSPNFDPHGEHRLSALKILPLQIAYPLTNAELPNPEMTTMLSGGVGAEASGVGGHTLTAGGDYEHRLTGLGSISLGDPLIAARHQNHGVRQQSSVVTGLSTGSLGNIFEPNKSVSEFTGFDVPVLLAPEAATTDDEIYIPKSFLDRPQESFGIYLPDAEQIVLGAGLQVLYGRSSPEAVNTQIRDIAALQQAAVDRGEVV